MNFHSVLLSLLLCGALIFVSCGCCSAVMEPTPDYYINVACSVVQSGDDIIITFQGGSDTLDLDTLEIRLNGNVKKTVSHPTPGDKITLSGAGTAGQDYIVIIAERNDGAQQVIYDGYV